MGGGKLLAPPVIKLNPLSEALTPIISPCHVVIMGMVQSQFDHFPGETVVAGLGGKSAAPDMGRMLAGQPEGHPVDLLDGFPADMFVACG